MCKPINKDISYGAFMAPTIKDPITDLYQKWGVVIANIMKNNPGGLDGVNPMFQKAKAKKLLVGKSQQEQLNVVISAQFAAIEANNNLQAVVEMYHELNPQ
jgi:hypothetical protein